MRPFIAGFRKRVELYQMEQHIANTYDLPTPFPRPALSTLRTMQTFAKIAIFVPTAKYVMERIRD